MISIKSFIIFPCDSLEITQYKKIKIYQLTIKSFSCILTLILSQSLLHPINNKNIIFLFKNKYFNQFIILIFLYHFTDH